MPDVAPPRVPDVAPPRVPGTRITIGGNLISYPGNVGINTASLKLVNFFLNGVLSRPSARFACFDIEFVYLGTPMDRPEYVRVKIANIPQGFFDKYNLHEFSKDVSA